MSAVASLKVWSYSKLLWQIILKLL